MTSMPEMETIHGIRVYTDKQMQEWGYIPINERTPELGLRMYVSDDHFTVMHPDRCDCQRIA